MNQRLSYSAAAPIVYKAPPLLDSHLDATAPTRDQQAQHLIYLGLKDGQLRRG
jgi:hypothetical protein